MRDTKDLLHALDEMPQPDIWATVSAARGSRVLGEDLEDPRLSPGPSSRRRVVIVVVAVALLVVPFAALWLAFRSSTTSKLRGPVQVPSGLIAYSAYADGRWQLFTVRPDGTDATMIPIPDLPENTFHPSWSPDGSRIVFDAQTGNAPGAAGGERDLYMVDADGSNLVQLTTSPGWDYLPSWSPDGSSIAYVHSTDGNDDIWVIGAAGSDPHRLTNDPAMDLDPAWAPDGGSVAFQSNRSGGPEIYVMASDGSDPTRLTRNTSFDGSPAWSPDGQTLAFASDQQGPGVYEMRSDGSDVRKLTEQTQVGPIEPAWSPNGSQIAFTAGSTDGSTTQLSVLDLASGDVNPVTSPGDLCCPSWRAATPDASPSLTAQVPDVVGLSLGDARRSIEASSLVLGSVSGGGPSDGKTLVIAQEPPPGSTVDGGAAVGVVVADNSGSAIAIDGVPFLVCRPVTTAGSFGDGLDEAWVFEEERVPGAGCIGSEGFQRLAIGSGSHVQVLSDRITDLLSDEAYKVWPYATPDLDGDGVDEIAVAKQGDQSTFRTVWLLRLVGGQEVAPVLADCGPACDPAPWKAMIGSVTRVDGSVVTAGVYCAPTDGPGTGNVVIEWRTSADDPTTILETRYLLKDQLLEVASHSSYQVSGPDGYPPSGASDLCGSPTSLSGG